MLHPLAAAFVLATPLLAQTAGGFSAGQLYLSTTSFADGGGAGLIRLDPWSGASQRTLSYSYAVVSVDGVAYDGFRDRLIVQAALSGTTQHLWEVDAAGNTTQLTAVTSNSVTNLAPASGGRIYYRLLGSSQNIHYLDAQNQQQVLMDATGLAPYEILPGSAAVVQQMEYHPGANALFLAGSSFSLVCPGGNNQDISVRRLPLSADGTRVIGPVTCTQFDVHPNGSPEVPKGLSLGPNGDLILAVDTNTGATQQRILRVDPATGGLSVYSSVGGYDGHGCLDGGVYSHGLGRAVVYHGCNTSLRSFSYGGPSTGFPLSLGFGGVPSGVGWMTEVFPIAPNGGLSASTSQISLASGGTQTLTIEAGVANAGNLYFVLGSASGTTPGLTLDVWHVPLAFDGYFSFTLGYANTPPLVATLGLLDASGSATAGFALPAGSSPSLAGALLHHAAVVSDFAVVVHATNAVGLLLLP